MILVSVLLIIIVLLSVTLIRLLYKPKIRGNQFVAHSFKKRIPPTVSPQMDMEQEQEQEQEEIVAQTPVVQERVISAEIVATDTEDADSILGLREVASVIPPAPQVQPTSTVVAPVISINLLAPPNRPYGGYELLQALLSNGLRFGQHQIFHHYQTTQSEGKVVFSCASLLKPGTFDLAKMGGFSTSGLALFLDTQSVENPKDSFETMLQTIDGIIEDLGGEVCDETHRPFTKATLVFIYRQIDQYVQSCHTPDLFATAES